MSVDADRFALPTRKRRAGLSDGLVRSAHVSTSTSVEWFGYHPSMIWHLQQPTTPPILVPSVSPSPIQAPVTPTPTPDIVVNIAGPSIWIPIATIAAAVFGAAVLYHNEIRKSKREDKRKILELDRADERAWHKELRDYYVAARVELRKLINIQREILDRENTDLDIYLDKEHQQVMASHDTLAAIADSIRPIADKMLIREFDDVRSAAMSFDRALAFMYHAEIYELYDIRQLNFYEVEHGLLIALKTSINRPTS